MILEDDIPVTPKPEPPPETPRPEDNPYDNYDPRQDDKDK